MDVSRVAIKQLTSSDLSFFAVHLRRSKQKGINLNANVFVELFYPGLRGRNDEIRFQLVIVGPGGRAPYPLTRKALRSSGAKNWRLNGEMVHDPVSEPGRFDALQEDDYGVLAFEGVERPDIVTLVLVSKSQDSELHAAIGRELRFDGRDTMLALPQSSLAALVETTRQAYPAQHPLDPLFLPDTPEEAIFGTAGSQQRAAQADGRGATISPETLRQHLRAAEEIGAQGEALFDSWLASTGHEEGDYEWVSRTHARATHDFHVSRPRWAGAAGTVFLDVKSTRGAFESPIHMSMAEIRWAASHPNHIVARVYSLGTPQPQVALLSGVHELAKRIMEGTVAALPAQVSVDSFELEVSGFPRLLTADLPPDLA